MSAEGSYFQIAVDVVFLELCVLSLVVVGSITGSQHSTSCTKGVIARLEGHRLERFLLTITIILLIIIIIIIIAAVSIMVLVIVLVGCIVSRRDPDATYVVGAMGVPSMFRLLLLLR